MALESAWFDDSAIPELSDQPRVVRALLAMMAAKHRPTFVHLRQVAYYARQFAIWLDMTPEMVRLTFTAGLLHDIGKTAVPDAILSKSGSLTNDEARTIIRHAEWGAEIAERSQCEPNLTAAIRHHHEWYDGSGYPDRIYGSEIPLAARIISIADAFDTMTTTRPYRTALGRGSALAELDRCKGTQFDPHLVSLFSEMVRSVWQRGESRSDLPKLTAVGNSIMQPLSLRFATEKE